MHLEQLEQRVSSALEQFSELREQLTNEKQNYHKVNEKLLNGSHKKLVPLKTVLNESLTAQYVIMQVEIRRCIKLGAKPDSFRGDSLLNMASNYRRFRVVCLLSGLYLL